MPNKKSTKLPIAIGAAVIITLVGGYFIFKTFSSPAATVTKTSSGSTVKSDPNVPGGTNNPADGDSESSGISTSKDGEGDLSMESGVTPKTPSGTFVSNHRPHLSGTPTPNTGSSSCITTPGAQCVIRFTKGSIVKSLDSKITNGQGAAEWNWSLQGIGLTEGTWKVTAIATNGGFTSQAEDSTDMVVSS